MTASADENRGPTKGHCNRAGGPSVVLWPDSYPRLATVGQLTAPPAPKAPTAPSDGARQMTDVQPPRRLKASDGAPVRTRSAAELAAAFSPRLRDRARAFVR